MARRLAGSALLLGLLAAGVVGASSGASVPVSSARAIAVQVIVPGQSGAVAGAVSAPPDASASTGFAYPADGSAVSAGSASAKASATSASTGSAASASATISSISLFRGEVTVGAVIASAHASATPAGASGDFSGAGVANLVVLGQSVGTAPGTRVALGDWGYADALVQSVTPGSVSGAPSYQQVMTGLAVHLTAEHGGLPAGTTILLGHAEVAAQGANPAPPPPPPATTTSRPTTTTAPRPTQKLTPKPNRGSAASEQKAKKPAVAARPTNGKKNRTPSPRPPEPPEAAPGGGLPVVHAPPVAETPKLTAGRYVFPVYGPSSYTNTFGAPRADVAWHHGVDIFAPLGAPVLAVADGTVFSVGWNHLGGYRLWLRDRQGNHFYYAHLSAYSPLATNGRKVRAGAVLGFVGNTGDAVGTPYHLHFEVHPVSLLHLGYDGAVDPQPYLDGWRHLQDVRFTPEGWAPPPGKPNRGVKPAPPAGAILLQATDISTASGLDPDSLARVLAPVSSEGDGALVGAAQEPPDGPRPVRPITGR
jgi:murein DD-endopeptidase MepM/ murein hydrolase activator NlpD